MSDKTRWANIICDSALRPQKMIVTDGETTNEIAVSNSKLRSVKKAAMDVYGVKPGNILVTQIVGEK